MVPNSCSVTDCGTKVLAKGLCPRHYHRLRNTGSTDAPIRRTPEQRFWAKVRKTKTCWLWTGPRHEYGHPQFKIGGSNVMVYRFSYELARGSIPEGKVLDHLCRVPWCVNPDHLDPVENSENVLRGIGPGAINKRKTHCIRGHELVPRPSQPQYRHCPICREVKQRERRARQGDKQASPAITLTITQEDA